MNEQYRWMIGWDFSSMPEDARYIVLVDHRDKKKELSYPGARGSYSKTEAITALTAIYEMTRDKESQYIERLDRT